MSQSVSFTDFSKRHMTHIIFRVNLFVLVTSRLDLIKGLTHTRRRDHVVIPPEP